MNQRERQKRLYVAQQGEKLRKGLINRREFLRRIGLAGFGVSAASMMRWDTGSLLRANPVMRRQTEMEMSADVEAWLREVGGRFSGSTIRISSESTPPSQIISQLAQEIFTPLTGINVQWEQTPLDQVLSKITLDTATENASNDIYYLDQAWVGRFVQDCVDTRVAYMDTDTDLNMPDYDFGDFVPELVPAIASYQGTLVGVPFDIPIFIMSYRTDVFDDLGLTPPTTMAEFMEVVKAIDAAGFTMEDGTVVRGFADQWRSGHYSLQTAWTAYLWAHGGSHVNAEGVSVINDEAAMAAAEYFVELGNHQPAGYTTWDWSGAGDAMAQGLAGVNILWGEFFPGYDNPETSKIAGLAEVAPLPQEIALRTPEECSFDEIPGIGHQGGSCLAISRYSTQPDAAWVFLQWATSKETTLLASLQSNTPVRTSTFEDPRTKEREVPGPGTTRHFPEMLNTIRTRMGTEPHFPGWAAASGTGGPIPTELGLMTTGQQDIATTLNNIAAAIDASIAEG